jgi:O-antigen/teichoic acid export membrane protein
MLVNQPGGYAAMGIYSAAGSWQKAILFLPGCLNAIALPMLSGFHGAKESGNYRMALKYNILLNAGSALAAAVVVSVSSGLIMRGYGRGFVEGSPVLIILSFATVLAAVNSVAGSAIASTGRTWAGLVFNLMWGIALLSGARLLIPGHGAAGLALATLISYILHSLWQVLYLRRLCRVTLG